MNLRANIPSVLACLALLCGAVGPCSAAAEPISGASSAAVVIQLISGSNSLELKPGDQDSTELEASTPVQVSTSGSTNSFIHPVQVFACISSGEAMRTTKRPSSVAVANLRVKNEHGEWVGLEPIPELQGRLGVLIGVLNGRFSTFLLQVQLHLPAGQAAGDYHGLLMLEAQEQ
jgi:hypothetical protein